MLPYGKRIIYISVPTLKLKDSNFQDLLFKVFHIKIAVTGDMVISLPLRPSVRKSCHHIGNIETDKYIIILNTDPLTCPQELI